MSISYSPPVDSTLQNLTMNIVLANVSHLADRRVQVICLRKTRECSIFY